MDINAAIKRGYELKQSIKAMEEELKAINQDIAKSANYKGKTGKIIGNGIIAKVQLKENVKWFQDRLEQLKNLFPDQFNFSFKSEYSPISKNLEINCLQNDKFTEGINWAREVKPGAPYVTYERIEDAETNN